MQHLQIDGIEIKYREFGSGNSTLILIHGFGGSPGDWNPLMDELASHYRIIAIGIKTFFSSPLPLTFSHQIGVLKHFLQIFMDLCGAVPVPAALCRRQLYTR